MLIHQTAFQSPISGCVKLLLLVISDSYFLLYQILLYHQFPGKCYSRFRYIIICYFKIPVPVWHIPVYGFSLAVVVIKKRVVASYYTALALIMIPTLARENPFQLRQRCENPTYLLP